MSTAKMEVLYSKKGQTADSMIERAAFRFQDYGQVLVVTDDLIEAAAREANAALSKQ